MIDPFFFFPFLLGVTTNSSHICDYPLVELLKCFSSFDLVLQLNHGPNGFSRYSGLAGIVKLVVGVGG